MSAPNPVPLSILDLSPVSEGSTVAQALRNSIDLARHAEAWGYRRYWVAEHHFVAVASSSPVVLIGAIAAATETIRVGAAAVQLGHNTAVGIVEAFGTLDALYPGRTRHPAAVLAFGTAVLVAAGRELRGIAATGSAGSGIRQPGR